MDKDETILKIARDNRLVRSEETYTDSDGKEVHIPDDLSSQFRDCWDFYDCSVRSIKAALEAAYEAGRQSLASQLQVDIANLPTKGTTVIASLYKTNVVEEPTPPTDQIMLAYRVGHRDARHAAVDTVLELTK